MKRKCNRKICIFLSFIFIVVILSFWDIPNEKTVNEPIDHRIERHPLDAKVKDVPRVEKPDAAVDPVKFHQLIYFSLAKMS